MSLCAIKKISMIFLIEVVLQVAIPTVELSQWCCIVPRTSQGLIRGPLNGQLTRVKYTTSSSHFKKSITLRAQWGAPSTPLSRSITEAYSWTTFSALSRNCHIITPLPPIRWAVLVRICGQPTPIVQPPVQVQWPRCSSWLWTTLARPLSCQPLREQGTTNSSHR